MKLPHAANAIVEPEEVRDYLLSPTHPIGRFKAAFFGMLGYSQDNWQALQAELRGIAALEATVDGKFSRFGNKYRVAYPDRTFRTVGIDRNRLDRSPQ